MKDDLYALRIYIVIDHCPCRTKCKSVMGEEKKPIEFTEWSSGWAVMHFQLFCVFFSSLISQYEENYRELYMDEVSYRLKCW